MSELLFIVGTSCFAAGCMIAGLWIHARDQERRELEAIKQQYCTEIIPKRIRDGEYRWN